MLKRQGILRCVNFIRCPRAFRQMLKSADLKQISLPCLPPRYCLQNVKSSCFTGLFPAMGTQRCYVGCWRRQISCSSLYSGDVVGSILHDVYKTPYWLKRWPRLWRSGFWTTKLINFRTVLMVPCKLTTWTYGFSEGRKFVGWRVNKERRVREAIEIFSGSNIEQGGQFWTSRDLPGCFVTWFTI